MAETSVYPDEASSYVMNDVTSEDTFGRVMNVTSEHEALMAYYYLDENNQVITTSDRITR